MLIKYSLKIHFHGQFKWLLNLPPKNINSGGNKKDWDNEVEQHIFYIKNNENEAN